MLQQLVLRRGRAQDDGCDGHRPETAFRNADGGSLRDRSVGRQAFDDFGRIDLAAADVDDVVCAPLEEEVAFGVEAAEIARIEPSPGDARTSPTAPVGTGCPPSSTTWTPIAATGRPTVPGTRRRSSGVATAISPTSLVA